MDRRVLVDLSFFLFCLIDLQLAKILPFLPPPLLSSHQKYLTSNAKALRKAFNNFCLHVAGSGQKKNFHDDSPVVGWFLGQWVSARKSSLVDVIEFVEYICTYVHSWLIFLKADIAWLILDNNFRFVIVNVINYAAIIL